MYELIQVSEHGYYVDCPSKIGIVTLPDNRVLLIDSGNDKNAAKKVRGILSTQGWTLSAILNTHSHADHIGGNAFLQEQTGCAIFAPAFEAVSVSYPLLEPTLLYGGNPPSSLRGKFLMAQPSNVRPLSEAVLPDYVQVIPLAGHTPDMVGFRVDDVIFLADCLSSEQTLEKYRIGVLWDVTAYQQTLEAVKTMHASLFVPSHAQPTADIVPLAQYNLDAVTDIAAHIAALCKTPLTFDELLTRLFDDYALTMSAEQYVLVGSTVRCYLTYLYEQGTVTTMTDSNRFLWATKEASV
ncbi:MAG: MBL fold metallo-hydrolase [Ruminococcaceae bacterium]|nr:MBL fold metallo-hydrolase [Oscillospiraceae bacterium]